MKARSRFLAALLALVALTASLAEQAWGAACLGMTDAPGQSVSHSGGHTGGADAPAAHGQQGHDAGHDERSQPRQGGGDCPMSALSACGAMTLALRGAPVLFADEANRVALPAAELAPGSLALSSLFRPPRL